MAAFELEEISTKDGLVHQGIFASPKKKQRIAILWVHGLTGKFYGDVAMMNMIAEACEKEGFGFASFNNCGHDMVASARKADGAYATIGSAVERFEDCIFDIDAGIDFLVSRGFTQVILIGNSTGSNKACFYASTQKHPNLFGIVLAGPMSDRYSSGYSKLRYDEISSYMQKEIDEERGDEMKIGFDFFPITPKRWMSLYGRDSAEDVFNYHDGPGSLKQFSTINTPTLVVIGSNDEHADKPVEVIAKAFDDHAANRHHHSVIISGASHGFDGKEKKFSQIVISWVKSLEKSG